MGEDRRELWDIIAHFRFQECDLIVGFLEREPFIQFQMLFDM